MHIAKAEKYLALPGIVLKLKQALIIGCKGKHYDNQCLFLYARHVRACYGKYLQEVSNFLRTFFDEPLSLVSTS